MSTLLEVSGVSVSFDGFKAINNLSIQIGEAELRAIIGPNGAGKTTFMDIVTGKTKPDEGYVIWGEKSVSLLDMNESQIAQAGIGRKFQKPTVFEEQTVRENITMALKNPRSPLDLLLNRAAADTEDRVRAVFVKEVVRCIHATSLISGTLVLFSGLSHTGPAGCQFRISSDQRCGFCARAVA